ncbi:kinase-like domain-containing protein [Mycena metata]|uniref:Kinase-like domain-containing protein n=1 Tax=Mycena metata TaxID=1033252 RepID=A0AAD7MVG8_9AGAR|nr:kinase-like domain-containing protein [Mycena metata]
MTKFAGPTSVSSSHNYLPDNSLPPSLPTDELDYGAIIANIPLPQDLDLSGEVVKVDAFSFESGKVAEISLGSMVRSQDTKEQKVAIKIFRRIHIDRNMLEKTVRDLYDEAREWTRLEHPNVLPFFGIALDLGPSPALIAPFCNSGRIMRYLTDVPNSPQERLAFAFGIAQGLAYLHAQGLVHGNLTTKKVLINDAGFPVICGYGLANVSGQLSENTVISPSARFTAPEYFIDESTQNHAALKTTAGDVYSLSMVILEIISGLRPYHDLHNELSVVLHILPGGRPSRSELDPLLVSDRFWGFLKHLWSHHPALRPDMNRVLLGLQSLSQSGSEKPEGGQAESGPFVFESNAEDSEREEEVSFGVWVSCFSKATLADLARYSASIPGGDKLPRSQRSPFQNR